MDGTVPGAERFLGLQPSSPRCGTPPSTDDSSEVMHMNGNEYADYLHLPDLLTLQEPRSRSQGAAIRSSEHFFIVVHQSTELLLRQALGDLLAVVRASGTDDWNWAGARTRLRRAGGVITLLGGHLHVLQHLPRQHFHAFRTALGEASGAQSRQFADLFELLGVASDTSPLRQAVKRAAGAQESVPSDVSAELDCLWHEVCDWQVAHAALVQSMLGDEEGTGGTSGADWLRSRISRQHEDAGGPAADGARCPFGSPAALGRGPEAGHEH
ncbi:tryptophan 2,3-dioxygenase family protein [Streptomyces sp. TRM 70351]|uniref:tryptophan 2,3-dioxygenase family protein n=1 Tax=Streptomyces sp. TRM 70351 TaxID=3116552 RepID=UPI002E7B74BD|nr:tryptophan 2,3-dioxygenase family protein [Streptomyces sp. TRM 70351]MEE1926692.1 tryptophan 2,3-dioxygenase family protein [Streptomyces sp. TRM 70351]